MPQSPYLPGTKIQFAWDSTSLGYLKTCPQLYYYHMIEGWVSKDESVHLRFGQEYHAAIQDYDTLRAGEIGFDDAVRETIRRLMVRIADWDPDQSAKAGQYKNRRTLVGLVVDYLDEYKSDPAETVILENGKPAVELSFRFELDWGPNEHQPYVLCGHLDRVVRFNEEIFVLDHKTTTTTPGPYFFDQWSPNNQMTLYTFAGQVVLDTTVKGVIIEAAQILLEKPNRFVRGFTYRTSDTIDEWLQDLEYHLASAQTYAEMNYWPRNDMSCDKYGGCRFRGVCSKNPSVREAFLKADFNQLPEQDRWNPLRSR